MGHFELILAGKYKQISQLLDQMEVYWAIEVTDSAISLIELNVTSDSERLHEYNQLILLWQNHIVELVSDLFTNWPFIYTSYQELFELLSIIKDNAKIADNGLRLARILSKLNFASKDQIAQFLEGLAVLTYETGDYQQAIEILYIAIFHRGNYYKTEIFDDCFNRFSMILEKLSPDQKPIILNCFLKNSFRAFFGSDLENETEQYKEFIDILYRGSINAVNTSLRDGLSAVKKYHTQVRDLNTNFDDIESTLSSLHMMKEQTWAFSIVLDYCENLKLHKKRDEMFKTLNLFIDQSFNQGNYRAAFQAISYKTAQFTASPGIFNLPITQIWAGAAKLFLDLEDQTLFVTSIDKLRQNLIIPEDYLSFQDFSYAKNEYYKLIHGHIPASAQDFWWTIFHRATFEEGDAEIAQLAAKKLGITALNYIDKIIKEKIPDVLEKRRALLASPKDISLNGEKPVKISLRLRISENLPMKIHSTHYYKDGNTTEELIQIPEKWHEPYLLELYENLPGLSNSDDPKPKKNSSPGHREFGKMAYLMLPLDFRNYFMAFNPKFKNSPEIYAVFDIPDFPLEIVSDKKPYGIKFSFGYRFREPPLTPHTKATIGSQSMEPGDQKYKIFTVGDLNSSYPVIWDEAHMKKVPFLAFPEGTAQSRFVATKLNNLSAYVDSVVSLNTAASTKKNIVEELKKGEFHVIHLASNLFYLDMNPLKSYFLTSDGETLSVAELVEILDYARAHKVLQKLNYVQPLIIFDGRILDHNSKPINRAFIPYSNIMKEISTKDIIGVLAKVTNHFDENMHDFLGTMLEQLLLSQSIGSSLLLGNRKLFLLGQKMQKSGSNAKLASILQEPHYIFYGEPSITLD